MNNNSQSGGYLNKPQTTNSLPGQLTITQFIQSVLVGISGLPGPMVRPNWQVAPPKQPDLEVNWLSFGIILSKPDTYPYIGVDSNGVSVMLRQQAMEITCSIVGPAAMENASLIQDGFQISQNLDALKAAKMGFTETNEARHIPDLVNERFINRVEMSIFLVRQIQRSYPILNLVSANGTTEANTPGSGLFPVPFAAQS